MSLRLRRALSIGIAAAVAVLVLVCVALVHHEGTSAEMHIQAAPMTSAGMAMTGSGSTAPDHTGEEHCSLVDLVACVRTSSSSLVGIVLLALGALALAFVVSGLLPGVRRISVWPTEIAPPSFGTAPSLSALCISRT